MNNRWVLNSFGVLVALAACFFAGCRLLTIG